MIPASCRSMSAHLRRPRFKLRAPVDAAGRDASRLCQATPPTARQRCQRNERLACQCCHLHLVLLALVWCAVPVADAWSAYNITTAADGARSVFATDLDGDGRVDVLSASVNDGKVAWYKNGGGSPLTWTAYNITMAADGAHSVYAADLDADGRIDVLSASHIDDKVAWYKNGGGSPLTWTAYTITTAADYAYSVFAVDLDADGRIDVLSASYNDDKVAWYRNGVGSPLTWTAYTISTAANGAVSVFAADLDADGRIDVLSASTQDSKVAWYKNGGGSPLTWTAYTITTAAINARSVFAADLDGDGRIDVLSASYLDDKVAWYKNGGGSPLTWTAYTIATAADAALSVFAADLDADGRIDVLSASSGDDKVTWYKNDGGSPLTWTVYTITSATDSANSVYAADLDADGRIDVLSASYYDDKVAWYRGCLPGFYAEGEACHPCPSGRFSMLGLMNPCTPCASGRYGVTVAMNASACSGNCTAGFTCPEGSINATVLACPAGQFSNPGASACSVCVAGRYGATAAMSTPGCTAACPAGTFGSASGLSTSACSGNCTAGYACPAGSTSATAVQCQPGTYSAAAASSCELCPEGRFGASAAFSSSLCSGTCTAGYFCPAGSASATQGACPPGQYSIAGAASCTNCSAGRYGASPGTNTPSCDAVCNPGYVCPPGSITGSPAGGQCPAGQYAFAGALACTNCTAGYACASGSGSPTPGANVCPAGRWSAAGAVSCTDCAAGYVGTTAGASNANCSGPCPAGQWSVAGASSCSLCPAGRFGNVSALTNSSCSGPCDEGFACDPGSSSQAPAGSQCPLGTYRVTVGVCSSCR